MYVFNTKQFRTCAPRNILKALSNHLESIEGKEVIFDKNGDGWIEKYQLNGNDYYLYPVDKRWCVERV